MGQLILTDVKKTINRRVILNNISLTLDSGGVYGFQGANGSGKTMLFRAIAGLVHIDSGAIDVFGKRIGRDVSFPESLGLTIENVGFRPHLTGPECLETLRRIKNTAPKSSVRDALTRVGLNPYDPRRYAEYSLGMKQKLAVAQAIMEKPSLLILDEPGNGLDADAAERLRTVLREEKTRGALVVVSSHEGEFLREVCDSVIHISNGAVA
jgi:ABC-2 type transport system ATP-binding protein